MGNRKGMDPDGRGVGEELERVEGKKTIIRIYCSGGESIFNKRKKEMFGCRWEVVSKMSFI